MTANGFDTRLEDFQQWRDSPWGRLRYALTEANLVRHLDPMPQRVLDVAGGDGLDAVRLAALGHEVTVLDPAGAMLSMAKENADAYDVADRLHVVQATAEDAPELFSRNDFDLVLCHNLLQYVDDRRAVLAAVMTPLRPGGLLSVLAPNADSDPLRSPIREVDPQRALLELHTDMPTTSPIGEVAWRYATEPIKTQSCCAAEEIVGHLVALGVNMVRRYGVRCVSDYIPDDEILLDPAFFADLKRLELAMSDRMPYLMTARFFHLIAQC